MKTKTFLTFEVQKAYREYTGALAELSKDISDFYKEKGMGVTVTIEETEVELHFSSHKTDYKEMSDDSIAFQDTLEELCRVYGLKITNIYSFWEQRMSFPPETRVFRFEKVILIPRGVKNDK